MATERWEIDSSHSGIYFSVRHLMIAKVRGQFSRWSGTLNVPDGDFARASLDVVVDATSIDTGVKDRDAHLRSADFFDTERFPDATFKATAVEKTGDGLRLVGDLTIRDITRPVTLDVEELGVVKDPWGNDRAAFTAKGAINRSDFGLRWNQALETGGVVVGERVDLEIELQAVRQAAQPAAVA